MDRLLIGSVAWNSTSLTKLKPFGSTLFANFLIGTSLLTYGLLLSYGLDPLWAVSLALQYCERPEYVNIDTQPYYIMVRFSAMALGLGFAVSSKNRKTALSNSRSLFCIALTIKGGLLIGKILSLLQKSLAQDDLLLYLATNFFLQLLYPYVIISVIPYLLHTLYLRK
ncbi:Glucose-6-phosphatase 3 [Armadillidium vulgare]|nr:Glucose-6-phosphatase 3 [Armadillidium vulgare]